MKRRTILVAALLLTLPACVVIQENTRPDCHSAAPLRLMAAAVPSASVVPCVRSLPLGWDYGSFTAGRGEAQFTLDGNGEDAGLLVVALRPACDVSQATSRPSDEQDARMFEAAPPGGPGYRRTILYTFPGGCAVYRFSFPQDPADGIVASVLESATFIHPASGDEGSG